MNRRQAARAATALVTLGSVLAIGATVLPAQAATAGWRRSATVSAGHGVAASFDGIAAVNANDAWATGAERGKSGTQTGRALGRQIMGPGTTAGEGSARMECLRVRVGAGRRLQH